VVALNSMEKARRGGRSETRNKKAAQIVDSCCYVEDLKPSLLGFSSGMTSDYSVYDHKDEPTSIYSAFWKWYTDWFVSS